MKRHLPSLLGCILILLSPSCAWAGGVKVSLSPSNQVVRQGDRPRFVVRVTAIGAPLRIMRFDLREDLLDNYSTIRVTRNGKEVNVPAFISDPGPTSDSDYKLLRPGQSMSYQHRGTPLVLEQLRPGNYLATVTLRPDWNGGSQSKSNSVSFRVISK